MKLSKKIKIIGLLSIITLILCAAVVIAKDYTVTATIDTSNLGTTAGNTNPNPPAVNSGAKLEIELVKNTVAGTEDVQLKFKFKDATKNVPTLTKAIWEKEIGTGAAFQFERISARGTYPLVYTDSATPNNLSLTNGYYYINYPAPWKKEDQKEKINWEEGIGNNNQFEIVVEIQKGDKWDKTSDKSPPITVNGTITCKTIAECFGEVDKKLISNLFIVK